MNTDISDTNGKLFVCFVKVQMFDAVVHVGIGYKLLQRNIASGVKSNI